MTFAILSQQIYAGKCFPFDFSGLGGGENIGALIYGISGFQFQAKVSGSGMIGSTKIEELQIQLTPNGGVGTTSLKITNNMNMDDMDPAQSWVEVCVLVFFDTPPPELLMAMSTDVPDGQLGPPLGLDANPQTSLGVLAGFNLSFDGGQSDLLGCGAAVGAAPNPYTTETQVCGLGNTTLTGDHDSSSNTLDIGLLAYSESQSGLTVTQRSHIAESQKNTYRMGSSYASLAGGAVFLQSFFLQYAPKAEGDHTTPELSKIQVGSQGATLNSPSGELTFTSTLTMEDLFFPAYATNLVASYIVVMLEDQSGQT